MSKKIREDKQQKGMKRAAKLLKRKSKKAKKVSSK
jgi:hypothetical protein